MSFLNFWTVRKVWEHGQPFHTRRVIIGGHRSIRRWETFAFQPIRQDGRLWGVTLRPEREYLPYSIELLGIANEFYQGT